MDLVFGKFCECLLFWSFFEMLVYSLMWMVDELFVFIEVMFSVIGIWCFGNIFNM